ncbi:MetQ/NlpA family ABC transporter substrate-binding protein [Kerstersia similis]|uniref:MetQ/NlpA family ABC transporter substrate-binding protein n=1 Tax=Kerstersia similis TaxID=206505 RepID=UPI0039EE29EE
MIQQAKKKLWLALGAAGLLMAAAVQAAPLKIGVSAVTAPSLEATAAEAKKQGLDVEVIEFSDWTAPNEALAAKDLDANFFQHLPFLDNAAKARGYRFKVVDVGFLMNVGLFSKSIRSLDAVPEGATISVYDDVTNQGRQLLFLQKLGLIKLKNPEDSFSTVHDIIENPKKLKFVEVPGPQLARALDDVDLAVGAPLFFVAAGRNDVASGGLAYSGAEDEKYAIHFVARDGEPTDPRLQQLIRIYQESPVVRRQIHESLGQDEKLYTLPWLERAAP